MPRIRPGMRRPPPGFDVVSDKLDEYEAAMKLAVQEESTGVMGQTTRGGTASLAHKRARDESKDRATAMSDVGGHAMSAPLQSPKEANEEADDDTTPPPPSAGEAVPPLWRIAAINRDRTRYVFDAYYRTHVISKEVFDYCCEMQFIDVGLARRWRLPGYEKLCCTACGVPGAASLAASTVTRYALRHTHERQMSASSTAAAGKEGATCICRVPAAERRNKTFLACGVCGCHGCCSADARSSDIH